MIIVVCTERRKISHCIRHFPPSNICQGKLYKVFTISQALSQELPPHVRSQCDLPIRPRAVVGDNPVYLSDKRPINLFGLSPVRIKAASSNLLVATSMAPALNPARTSLVRRKIPVDWQSSRTHYKNPGYESCKWRRDRPFSFQQTILSLIAPANTIVSISTTLFYLIIQFL